MSKYISYLLRHGAIKEGIAIDTDGYVMVDDLLLFIKNHKADITTLEHLQAITKEDKKQRFTLIQDNNSNWKMKANQGHSINIVSNESLTLITDASKYPEVIHGTFKRLLPAILKTGLSKMSRNHIHMANGTNAMSGIRGNTNVFIYVDMEKAMADGIEFFISDNGVILTSSTLSSKYFKKVIDAKGHNLLKSNNVHIPCAGCIVFHIIDNVLHVCLVKTHSGVYGYPKGKRERGETLMVAALRELNEETGIKESDIEPIQEGKAVFESSVPSATRKGNISTKLYVTKLVSNIPALAASDTDEIESCSFISVDLAMTLLMDKRKIVLEQAIKLH